MTKKACVCCIGLCEDYEPLGPGSGTLADGTTWAITNGAITNGDPATGDIEWDDAQNPMRIEFSEPVQLRITPYGIPSTRILWHETNAVQRTKMIVDSGSTGWTYTPGAVDLITSGQAEFEDDNYTIDTVDGIGNSGLDVNADYGQLYAKYVTEFEAFTNAFDAARFEVAPMTLGCKKDVCEVIDELRCDIASVQNQVDAIVDDDDQTLSLSGTTLTISDGNSVDLTPFLDNTDDQALSLSGNTLQLEDGGSVDLSVFLDNTDNQTITAFSLAGTVLTLAIEDGNTVTVDLASIDTDTDDQTLALAGTILSIADGNSIDLAAINTDDQQITNFSLAGTVLTLTLEDGGTQTVDLASIDTDTDTDDQTLSLAGTLLSIADGNTIDLAAIDTDDQTLSTTTAADGSTDSITISEGNTVAIVHPDPVLTTETVPAVLGYVNVNADGSVAASAGGAGASRQTTGRYNLTPPAGAETVQLTVLETAGRDSIEIHPNDFTGTSIQIHEGDNGTAANTFRDREFTAVWYGQSTIITNVSH